MSGALIVDPKNAFSSNHKVSSDFFGVHPFIEQNPEAVFIMRTSVDVKTNSETKKQVGVDFGKSVFVEQAEGGVPISNIVAIKPNLTDRNTNDPYYTRESCMGIITDPYFVEGIIESMKELGISSDQFYMREVNGAEDFTEGGYTAMASRTGADLRNLGAKVGVISESDLQWMDVPDGVWFNKIPYLWPINAQDSFLINIAKLKAHGMGLTLCAKNLQGTIAHNYQAHCSSYYSNMDMSSSHMNSNAKQVIMENYNRHVADGIPRWDRPSGNHTGGLGQETWASRCIDNNSVTRPNLHIIEGIYGRDGNFIAGPSPEGLATDYMSNVIIFGKNAFNVDIIGHWLGGHEPGNFGLFHLAIERGLSSVLNPMDIPVYDWKSDGTATLSPLDEFERTPLKTNYLRRDYDGQTEDKWHLCNEPYDYKPLSVDLSDRSNKPESFVLLQNYPNPFNPSTTIAFKLPDRGYTRLEIYNMRGEIVDVLVDRYCDKGSHMAIWKAHNHSSGTYFYKLYFKSFSETKKLTLIK